MLSLNRALFFPLPLLMASCMINVSPDPLPLEGQVAHHRPLVARGTETVPDGELLVEAGASLDPGDRFSIPFRFRGGSGEGQEMYLEWSPFEYASVPGSDIRRVGDLNLGLRQRVTNESAHRPSLLWQADVKIPTAGEDIPVSSGEIDFSAGVVASNRVGDYRLNGIYDLGLLGEIGDDGLDLRHTFALATIAPRYQVYDPFAEFVGVFTPERDISDIRAKFGVFRELKSRSILDVGFTLGLSSDAPDFELFIGVSRGVGHVEALRALDSP